MDKSLLVQGISKSCMWEHTFNNITCVIFSWLVLLDQKTYPRKVDNKCHKYYHSSLCKTLVWNKGVFHWRFKWNLSKLINLQIDFASYNGRGAWKLINAKIYTRRSQLQYFKIVILFLCRIVLSCGLAKTQLV